MINLPDRDYFRTPTIWCLQRLFNHVLYSKLRFQCVCNFILLSMLQQGLGKALPLFKSKAISQKETRLRATIFTLQRE